MTYAYKDIELNLSLFSDEETSIRDDIQTNTEFERKKDRRKAKLTNTYTEFIHVVEFIAVRISCSHSFEWNHARAPFCSLSFALFSLSSL